MAAKLSDSLKHISDIINDDKKEWTETFHALEQLGRLADNPDFEDSFAELDLDLANGIATHITSPRSELARQASFTAAKVVSMADNVKRFSEVIMDHLLDNPQSNSVIRRFNTHAGQVIAKHNKSGRIIRRIGSVMKESKSKYAVVPCMSYLYVSLNEMKQDFVNKHAHEYTDAILAGLSCFNALGRRHAVACATKFKEKAAEKWEPFMKSLDKRKFKMVRSFESRDRPHLMLSQVSEQKRHAQREIRIERKKAALKKIRTKPFEKAPIELNLQNLKAHFASIDVNADGKISKFELAKALEATGIDKVHAKTHAHNFFRIADLNGSGFVDQDEFLIEVTRMQMLSTVRAIHRRFKKIDADHNGEISKEELHKYLSARLSDAPLVNEIIDGMYKSMDRDKSGGVSMDELEDWYVRTEDAIYESRVLATDAISQTFEAAGKPPLPLPEAKMKLAAELLRESGLENKNQTPRPMNAEKKLGNKANLVVTCGPSAVGKGTILGILKKKYPGMFAVAISHTTRGPRKGEEDGKHYHFVDTETFVAMRDNGEFLEHADVHGKFYGTSKAAVNKVCDNGGICILEIDVQGAQAVKMSKVEAKFLFITTSGGIQELEKRLRGRGTESEEKIQKRLKTSARELHFLETNPKFFDKILVNDELSKATEELRETFSSWYPQLQKSASL